MAGSDPAMLADPLETAVAFCLFSDPVPLPAYDGFWSRVTIHAASAKDILAWA